MTATSPHPTGEPRVVVYTGDGCLLCADAIEMLEQLGIGYDTASDERYRERIPVITIDGAIVTEGRVSKRAIEAALRRARK